MDKKTIALHTPYERRDAYDSLAVPVYNNVAFEFDNAAVMSDAFCNRISAPDYTRVENPTVTQLERRVQAVTGAAAVTALNTGMAAISNALLAVVKAGANIVTSVHLFGKTFSLITTTLARLGVQVKLCDLTNPALVEEAVNGDTCCIFLEILTNPQLEVADLSALSKIARRHNIPLMADSTMIPFTETRLKDLGVDVEIVSSTKYLSGGGTSLGGLVIDYGSFSGISDRIKLELLFNLGAYMNPQAAYMQTLGLETLDARYQRQASNALELARRLKGLVKVNYPGLEDNPYYELSRRQFGPTSGAMLTLELESPEACFRFIDKLKLIHRATNLFDSRSLAIHPASTIFGNFPPEDLPGMGVKQTVIRLSVGLEDVEDLFLDIQQALQ